MAGAAAQGKIRDNTAKPWPNAKAMPAHAGSDDQARQLGRVIDDGHHIGHGVNHTSPSFAHLWRANFRKRTGKKLLNTGYCNGAWVWVENADLFKG